MIHYQLANYMKNSNMESWMVLDNQGLTPFHCAVHSGHEKIIKLFMKNQKKLGLGIEVMSLE